MKFSRRDFIKSALVAAVAALLPKAKEEIVVEVDCQDAESQVNSWREVIEGFSQLPGLRPMWDMPDCRDACEPEIVLHFNERGTTTWLEAAAEWQRQRLEHARVLLSVLKNASDET